MPINNIDLQNTQSIYNQYNSQYTNYYDTNYYDNSYQMRPYFNIVSPFVTSYIYTDMAINQEELDYQQAIFESLRD